MSRTLVTSDDPAFGYLTEGGTLPVVIVDGEDLATVRVRNVYESIDDLPRTAKSVRVPTAFVEAAEALNHPDGFSGVVREALALYLRHNGDDTAMAEISQVRHALATVADYVNRHAA